MSDAECIELLKKLVALPSVHPEHTDQPDIANEFRVAEFMASHLASLGMSIEWDRLSPERANVIATFGPERDPVHTLLLESHLDTVGVAEMTIPPFEPNEREGRLYGRGSCDTKGPMAAAMAALTPDRLNQLAAAGVRLIYVGAYGEEKGNEGAIRLAQRGLGADTAIILEPTDLEIVYAHKGIRWLEITLIGRSAHGSNPGQGVNAIVAMSRLIDRLETHMVKEQQVHGDSPLGLPTQNIGRISGGRATNIVAHQCRIDVDRRLLPNEDPEAWVQYVRSECERLVQEGAATGYDVKVTNQGEPFATETDTPLVRRLQKAIEAEGRAPALQAATWFSDAGPFSAICKEIVVFGPGSIKEAHTADEYIVVDELLAGKAILGRYLDLVIADFSNEK